jgi:hypothetical protein
MRRRAWSHDHYVREPVISAYAGIVIILAVTAIYAYTLTPQRPGRVRVVRCPDTSNNAHWASALPKTSVTRSCSLS